MKKKILLLKSCFECGYNRGNFCAKDKKAIDLHEDIVKNDKRGCGEFPSWCGLPNSLFESKYILGKKV